MENVDRCICCGEIIPEGRQVCPNCEVKAAAKGLVEEARQFIIQARQVCEKLEKDLSEIVKTLFNALKPIAESLAEIFKEAEKQQELNNRAARRGRKTPKPWETHKRRFYDK